LFLRAVIFFFEVRGGDPRLFPFLFVFLCKEADIFRRPSVVSPPLDPSFFSFDQTV